MRSPPPAPPRRSALFPRSPRTCRGRRARSAHARSHLPIAGSFIVAADVVDLGFGDVIVDLRMLHPAGEKCRDPRPSAQQRRGEKTRLFLLHQVPCGIVPFGRCVGNVSSVCLRVPPSNVPPSNVCVCVCVCVSVCSE